MINVWVFDLDGTLYDYQICNKAGEDALFARMEELWRIDTDSCRRVLKKAKQTTKNKMGPVAASHNRILYAQNICEQFGEKAGRYELILYEAYWNAFLDRMDLFPGMKHLIEELKKKNRKLVLLTDLTAHIQFRKIKQLGIEGLFDYVITSEEAGVEKPSEKMFDLVLEKTGEKIETMMMVGDDVEKDIRGAERFGLQTLLFHNDPRFYEEVEKWI